MDFGFQARGGTAPTLTSVAYGGSTRQGTTTPVPIGSSRACEQFLDTGDHLAGVRTATIPNNEKRARSRRSNHVNGKTNTRGGPITSTKKVARGYRGARASWGKRRNNCEDSSGTMSSRRPASRQALSDLTDLNLALKYNKMQTKKSTCDGGGGVDDSMLHSNVASIQQSGNSKEEGASASTAQLESLFNGQSEATAISSAHGQRHSSRSAGYITTADGACIPVSSGVQHFEGHGKAEDPEERTYPPCLDEVNQNHNRSKKSDSSSTKKDIPFCTSTSEMAITARYAPVAKSRSKSCSGLKSSDMALRVSPAASKKQQMNTTTRERAAAVKSEQCALGGSQRERGPIASSTGAGDYGDCWTNASDDVDTADVATISPRDEASVAQSEKDQRVWSALRTSLLSDCLAPGDEPFTGFCVVDDEVFASDGSLSFVDGAETTGRSPAKVALFDHESKIQGTRDMEQLDLERSAMDRNMRPYRTSSARLLHIDLNPSSSNKAQRKHLRNYSASAARPRTCQNEQSVGGFSTVSGGDLECTGIRAELVPRKGEGNAAFHTRVTEGFHGFATGTRKYPNAGKRGSVQSLNRNYDTGRFQWVTDDEGVANCLQRPPSRQKEAFPTNLADVVPYVAFQAENRPQDNESKQHVEGARKTAVEQTRPPSRHKPPARSLFLEVPETRRHIPPTHSPTAQATHSCRGVTPGRLTMDNADTEATATRDGLGSVFALDCRNDNPDRDGFSVLQVQGPCPFRIEVTNSFVQPHARTIPGGRETKSLSTNRSSTRKGKACSTDPASLPFGTSTHETRGRDSVGKQRIPSGITQRAPTSTTPNVTGVTLISPLQARGDTGGKSSPIAKPIRMLGSSRSYAGIDSRSESSGTIRSARGDDEVVVDDTQPPPLLLASAGKEMEFAGGRNAIGCVVLEGRRDAMAEEISWREDFAGIEDIAGRGDNSLGLRVSTGAQTITVSDWSLQSCDDADDTTFFDGSASTLIDLPNTKRTLLDTTLGQDFLSLFAPSCCDQDETSVVSTFDAL